MGVRVIKDVSIEEIKDFKFNLQKARRFACLLQNGTRLTPVHLQTIADDGIVKYKIKSGFDKAAAYSMLGKEHVLAKFSPEVARNPE